MELDKYKSSKILLTGATGFLGSNIAHELVKQGYLLICTCRKNSSFDRLNGILDSIVWINLDDANWKEIIKKEKFDLLIHSAWEGVSLLERDCWEVQLRNFEFSKSIFAEAYNSGASRIISLGSQAEYGIYSEKVTEKYATLPVDAYGSVKLLTLYYLFNLAKSLNKEWYWLRIFSVFGKRENDKWLIPTVIRSCINAESIDLTDGHQIYDYIYSGEFADNLVRVVKCKNDHSGIYNLCSGKGIEIRDLLIRISMNFFQRESLLKFGKLDHRKNQNMYMVGNNDKFENTFGKVSLNSLDSSIKETINYYLMK